MLDSKIEALLAQRYYHQNETSWEQVVDRIVENICDEETPKFQEKIKESLLRRIWLPNSPAIVNAGKETGLMACFVAGPTEDTLENHAETLMEIAQVGKAGGGCGFTGTFIRPENSPVAGSAHGFAYGPNNWAIQVNNYLDMITQGGFRRMALMYTLHSDHPDLDKFLDLKQNSESHGARFNQSVMATDKWMKTATTDLNSKQHQQLKKISENAWNNGEPGLLFFDRINNDTPYKGVGETIHATNPCGEQPLPPYGSCNLGSINIAHDYFAYDDAYFDFDRLSRTVKEMTRFLDNVGSKNIFPSQKFQDWYNDFRPIGIGIMGFADLLLKLHLKYGSVQSQKLLKNIMSCIYSSAKAESEKLGIERGVPKKCKHVNRRNITMVSIAPTGSIAFIAGTTHGIEPVFSPSFTRTDERGEKYTFDHPQADKDYFSSTINEDKGKIPTWKEHIDIQAAAQSFCDSGVSKTINFEEGVTPDTIYDAFVYAWEQGLKGITVYRNNSRQVQVLNDNNSERPESIQIIKNNAPKRPSRLKCWINNTSVQGENWVVLIGVLGDDPYELFAYPNGKISHKEGVLIKRGKGVYDLEFGGEIHVLDIAETYLTDEQRALTRMVSMALRHGVEVRHIYTQLEKSQGSIVSFSKAINRSLKKLLKENSSVGIKCSECGNEMMFVENCLSCPACGNSKCS